MAEVIVVFTVAVLLVVMLDHLKPKKKDE